MTLTARYGEADDTCQSQGQDSFSKQTLVTDVLDSWNGTRLDMWLDKSLSDGALWLLTEDRGDVKKALVGLGRDSLHQDKNNREEPTFSSGWLMAGEEKED